MYECMNVHVNVHMSRKTLICTSHVCTLSINKLTRFSELSVFLSLNKHLPLGRDDGSYSIYTQCIYIHLMSDISMYMIIRRDQKQFK